MPFFRQRDGRGGGQGDPLVRGAEQLVADETGGQIGFGVEPAQPAQALAIVEKPRVEEIGRLATRFGREPAETQHTARQGVGQEVLLEPGHWRGSLPVNFAAAVRIITLNINGIRSAERKGLSRWLVRAEPWDVVCLQDLKAGPDA